MGVGLLRTEFDSTGETPSASSPWLFSLRTTCRPKCPDMGVGLLIAEFDSTGEIPVRFLPFAIRRRLAQAEHPPELARGLARHLHAIAPRRPGEVATRALGSSRSTPRGRNKRQVEKLVDVRAVRRHAAGHEAFGQLQGLLQGVATAAPLAGAPRERSA